MGFYLSKGAKLGRKRMDGTAPKLLLAVQGCTLYETKGVFPPQIAPGTDSLQHTVHLLLRHKNTSNVKNMKLEWSFPHFCVPQPSSPNSMLSTPSEVLLDTLAWLSHPQDEWQFSQSVPFFAAHPPKKPDSLHSMNASVTHKGLRSQGPVCSCSILTCILIALQPPDNFSTVFQALLCLDSSSHAAYSAGPRGCPLALQSCQRQRCRASAGIPSG